MEKIETVFQRISTSKKEKILLKNQSQGETFKEYKSQNITQIYFRYVSCGVFHILKT